MIEQVRALRAYEWDGTPLSETTPYPPRREGESVVRMEAAAVSHLDLTVLGGKFRIRPDLPYIGGVEGAGVIVESRRFAPGTSVALRGGGIGMSRIGTWAEYVAVPDDALRTVSPRLRPEIAATSFSPLSTAYLALHDVGKLGDAGVPAHEEVVAVTGAGGAVGAVAVQLAQRAGVTVIALVSRSESAAAVPKGARVVVLSDADAVAELAGKREISLLIDTVGGNALADRIDWVRPGGRVALVGYTAGTEVTLNLPNWLIGDVALLPVNLIRREERARAIIDELNELVADGAIELGIETFPFQSAGDAFARLRSGRARGKIAISY